MMSRFDLDKYVEHPWYQIMASPGTFYSPQDRNVVFYYSRRADGAVVIHKHLQRGKDWFVIPGLGTPTTKSNQYCVLFNVSTDDSYSWQVGADDCSWSCPNYIIDALWMDVAGTYVAAVVTDMWSSSICGLTCIPRPPSHIHHQMSQYIDSYYPHLKVKLTPQDAAPAGLTIN